jgi:SAM-dependent methyltransferase
VFTESAKVYDAIYSFKDYAGESERLHALIQKHKRSDGTSLLDVGCGTGGHVAYLRQWYAVEGLDLDPNILEVSRQRYPDVPFHQADMVGFDLGRQFDVVVCLFGSIGYAVTLPRMRQAIASMVSHLRPGGVLVVEPWLTPDRYSAGRLYAQFVDQPDLKVARMNVSAVENGVSILNFHYLIGTPAGVEHVVERHELGLFNDDEYQDAIRAVGLEVVPIPEGVGTWERGVYLARFLQCDT